MKTRIESQRARLTRLAARPSPVKPVQCRACLADESFTFTGEHVPGKGSKAVSSIGGNGLCTDREACESRQPALFALEPETEREAS